MNRELSARICRCCLNKNIPNMICLQNISKEGMTYSEIFEFLIGFVESAPLPNFLCNFCECALIEAYLFKKKCISNLEKFCWEKYDEQLDEEHDDIDPTNTLLNLRETSSGYDQLVQKNTAEIDANLEIISNTQDNCSSNTLYENHDMILNLICDDEKSIIPKNDQDSFQQHFKEVNRSFNLDNCTIKIYSNEDNNADIFENNDNNQDIYPQQSKSNSMKIKSKKNEQNSGRVCRKCNLKFSTGKDYFNHYAKNHRNKESYKCIPCDLEFNVKREYDLHLSDVHKNEGLVLHNCSKCNINFDSVRNYDLHYEKFHRQKNRLFIKCYKCDMVFHTKGVFTDHCFNVHGDKHLNDVENAQTISKNDEQSNNSEAKTDDDSYVRGCLKCGLQFFNKKDYFNHYARQHRKKDLCPHCGKLVQNQYLKTHIERHVNPKQFFCRECGKSFTLYANMRKHERIHSNDRRYKCEYCDKQFIHWNSRRCHIRIYHTGEKNFECHLCDKKFGIKTTLEDHIRTHTGEKPFECPQCSEKFTRKNSLKSHMSTHSNERNEICEVCNKAFRTRRALKNHYRMHSGVKNYVCSICSKAFTQGHVLKTHMKTHPGCTVLPHRTILPINKPVAVSKLNQITMLE